MYSERSSRMGGISERTLIENNSLHGKIPHRFAVRNLQPTDVEFFRGKKTWRGGKKVEEA